MLDSLHFLAKERCKSHLMSTASQRERWELGVERLAILLVQVHELLYIAEASVAQIVPTIMRENIEAEMKSYEELEAGHMYLLSIIE